MKIALDAMGGDKAPSEIVRGAVLASENIPDITLQLAGDQNTLKSELNSTGKTFTNIEIIPSTQVVSMTDSPVEAIRTKPDSSLINCIKSVKKREASAFISAGNTGAVVAGATMLLGFLQGVKRPGIAVPFPTKKGLCYVIDGGANIHCNPLHLLQYGIMASVYCQQARGIPNPKVGLLNIGEEDTKGNELVKQTFALLKKSGVNFIGSIEARSIFNGDCDVIVCEGFVGNVMLKCVEGFAEFTMSGIMGAVKSYSEEHGESKPMDNILMKLKKKGDYAEYGGAPLLGLNGIVIICHGRSNARAIANAISVAVESTRHNLNKEILKHLNTVQKYISWIDILKSWKARR